MREKEGNWRASCPNFRTANHGRTNWTPSKPKSKRKKGKRGKIRTLPTTACIDVKIIGKREKKERKTYLKRRRSRECRCTQLIGKNHGQRKLEVGERRVSQKKQRYFSKNKKTNGEVLKTKKPKRTENQRETQ